MKYRPNNEINGEFQPLCDYLHTGNGCYNTDKDCVELWAVIIDDIARGFCATAESAVIKQLIPSCARVGCSECS